MRSTCSSVEWIDTWLGRGCVVEFGRDARLSGRVGGVDMNAPANVGSVEAVRDFRSDLLRFGEQATDCLDSLYGQVHRMVDWLEHDRPAYWQQQVRRAYDRVAAARLGLQRCRMRQVGDHRPACVEEKQELTRAKARLEYSRQQVEVVRRCQRVVEEEANQFRGRCGQVENLLERDVPRMAGLLDRILVSLEAYVATAAPESLPLVVDDDSAASKSSGPGKES